MREALERATRPENRAAAMHPASAVARGAPSQTKIEPVCGELLVFWAISNSPHTGLVAAMVVYNLGIIVVLDPRPAA